MRFIPSLAHISVCLLIILVMIARQDRMPLWAWLVNIPVAALQLWLAADSWPEEDN